MTMRAFLAELQRRNVLRIAAAYVAASWLLIQVAETLFPIFGLTEAVVRTVIIVLLIGFLPALVFAWVYELTPEGLKLERDVDRSRSITTHTGKKLDRVIIGVLGLAVVVFALDRFIFDPARDASRLEAAREQGRSEALMASFGDTSIAVLPFVDMSPDGDQEYLGDGLAEELLNLLARIPQLRVAARTSAFSYKSSDAKIPEIAAELNVGHVLEGSVRKTGEEVRITAQLIEGTSDSHVWSETYDRTLDDIFSIQDDIARQVVDKLKVTLLGEVPTTNDVDPAAYELFLKAQFFNARVSEENLAKAEDALTRALAIDPDFPAAWTALGVTYRNQAQFGYRDVHEGTMKARTALTRALAIDPDNGHAWARLGVISTTYDWDFAAAETAMRRAYELSPGNVSVLSASARLAAITGDYDRAVTRYREAIVLEPLSLSTRMNLGWTLLYAGRTSEARETLTELAALDPTYPLVNCLLAQTDLVDGNATAAMSQLELETGAEWRDYGRALALYSAGDSDAADAALDHFVRTYGDSWAYQIAVLHAHRGDANEAFEWLDRAYARRDSGIVWILGEPFARSLKRDPRWPAVIERLGLAR